ncbi:MAG: hypothetical protein OXI33_02365 [Chloroflexota bacterium]|nr:hypothetical protein [Chloroflexota bacterium]
MRDLYAHGLEQPSAYMGHLVVFDIRERRNWKERILREEHTHDGKRISVWGK